MVVQCVCVCEAKHVCVCVCVCVDPGSIGSRRSFQRQLLYMSLVAAEADLEIASWRATAKVRMR